MGDKTVTVEEMTTRVARYSDATFSEAAFLDSVLPEYKRKIFNMIGSGVTEDPSMRAAITAAEGFHIGYIKATKGNGAALHSHKTVEVFMPLAGRWEIYWGDDGEEAVELDTFDVISVPVGIMRGFRCLSDEDSVLFAINGGADPGKVTWPQGLLDRVREVGYALDEKGNIVDLKSGETTASALAGREGTGHGGKGRPIAREEVLARVARFGELTFSEAAFIDSLLPEYKRKIINVIGTGVTEDPDLKPAITAVEGFNVTMIKAEKGNGASLHGHTTVEVFVAMTGRWAIYWGDQGEHEIVLDPFDIISVPVGVDRGFRNMSEGENVLMAIVGGDDAGKVSWPEPLVARVEALGYARDGDGHIGPAAVA